MSIKSNKRVIQESVSDEDIQEEVKEEKPPIFRNSVERLDTQVSSLHQDVATLSIEVRNAIQALQEMTYSTITHMDHHVPARSIPNLQNGTGTTHIAQEYLTRSSSQPAEIWHRSNPHIIKSVSDLIWWDLRLKLPKRMIWRFDIVLIAHRINLSHMLWLTSRRRPTRRSITSSWSIWVSFSSLKFFPANIDLIFFHPSQVLTNSQLVLNILSVNTTMPVNFPPAEIKPLNCLSTLTTIPEAISSEPSCSNLHDLSKESNVAPEQTWCIYGNDQENSKSTDALLEDTVREQEEEGEQGDFPGSLSFSIIKENLYKSNSGSRVSLEALDKPTVLRSRSGSRNASKIYEPISNESLTDSQGYMDDFDESCALITNDNSNKKRNLSSNDLIMKRNSLGVNKVPQSHRFSAGDADKLEKGIKALPSTRSLRDSWIQWSSGNVANCFSFRFTIFQAYQRKISIPNISSISIYKKPDVYKF